MEVLPIFASEQDFIGHRLCCGHGCRKKRHSVSLRYVNRQNSVINLHKSVAFVYTNNELSEKKISGNNPIYDQAKKNEIPRDKLNDGCARPIFSKV